jgi:hypothetical protein
MSKESKEKRHSQTIIIYCLFELRLLFPDQTGLIPSEQNLAWPWNKNCGLWKVPAQRNHGGANSSHQQ